MGVALSPPCKSVAAIVVVFMVAALALIIALTTIAIAVMPMFVLLGPTTVAPTIPIGVFVLVAVANPLVLNEVHGLAACTVSSAVTAPILLMHGWHVEVDRLPIDHVLRLGNEHRLRQHKSWPRKLAYVDPAVDAGLIDADRNAHTRLSYCGTDCTCGESHSDDGFHIHFQL